MQGFKFGIFSVFLMLTLSACLQDKSDKKTQTPFDFSSQSTLGSGAISEYDGHLYFTSPHSHQLIKWDTQSKSTLWKKDMGLGSAGVTIDEQDQRIFSAATDEGVVYVHHLDGQLIATINAVQQPVGVLWLAGLKHLLVSDQGLNQLIIFDESLQEVNRLSLAGAPRGLAYSAQTQQILVTCFLSDKFVSIDVSAQVVADEFKMALSNVQYHAVNFKARLAQNIEIYQQQVLIPHTQSNHEKTNLIFDGTVAPRVSAFHLDDLSLDASRVVALDTLDRSVNQPNDLAVDKLNGNRWVVNSGSNNISIFSDAPTQFVSHIEVGKRPNSIWLDSQNRRAYVFNALSYTLSEIDMDNHQVLAEHLVTSQTVSDNIQLGMEVFFLATDTRAAKDAWITCAICHPDGKQDGLVWQQGLGPRNSTSMQGLEQSGQLHWSGNRDEVQDFEHTFRNLMGGTGFVDNPATELGENMAGKSLELDALAEFIFNIPFAKPLKPEFLDMTSVARGKIIFESEQATCRSCHTGRAYTKSQAGVLDTNNVGTQTRQDDFIEENRYDTPSLRGLAFSAPYLHDGSATNLLQVIGEYNDQDLHGVTSHLSHAQQLDLVAFLNSL